MYEVGVGTGKYYSVNVPLRNGIDDEGMYIYIYVCMYLYSFLSLAPCLSLSLSISVSVSLSPHVCVYV